MQKGGFVPKSDVKQNANSGNLDKILHFLALIFARIFVFESTFCKNNDTKFNSIDKHLRLQIVAMLCKHPKFAVLILHKKALI